jgi:hypothetical protein
MKQSVGAIPSESEYHAPGVCHWTLQSEQPQVNRPPLDTRGGLLTRSHSTGRAMSGLTWGVYHFLLILLSGLIAMLLVIGIEGDLLKGGRGHSPPAKILKQGLGVLNTTQSSPVLADILWTASAVMKSLNTRGRHVLDIPARP